MRLPALSLLLTHMFHFYLSCTLLLAPLTSSRSQTIYYIINTFSVYTTIYQQIFSRCFSDICNFIQLVDLWLLLTSLSENHPGTYSFIIFSTYGVNRFSNIFVSLILYKLSLRVISLYNLYNSVYINRYYISYIIICIYTVRIKYFIKMVYYKLKWWRKW